MQLFGIIVAGLSVASVQAIAVPGLPAAGLLFARQDHPPESPCLHPGGKKKCQIDCASKNADFWSCAPYVYLRLSLHLDHGFAAYCYAHWATGSDVGPANSGPDAQWVSYTERVV
ncbi:hypothetical protein NCS56_00221700 [Fusarium sp. Ph1]|nr:hypothetical protein NCS56_00221700 [Fusarium sp. Ph1]